MLFGGFRLLCLAFADWFLGSLLGGFRLLLRCLFVWMLLFRVVLWFGLLGMSVVYLFWMFVGFRGICVDFGISG